MPLLTKAVPLPAFPLMAQAAPIASMVSVFVVGTVNIVPPERLNVQLVKVPPATRDKFLLSNSILPEPFNAPAKVSVPAPLIMPSDQLRLPPMAKFPAPVIVGFDVERVALPVTERFAFKVNLPPVSDKEEMVCAAFSTISEADVPE